MSEPMASIVTAAIFLVPAVLLCAWLEWGKCRKCGARGVRLSGFCIDCEPEGDCF
jgi:hypothetical protein